MSERMTKRLANGGVMYDNGEYWKVCYPWNENCLSEIDRMAIKLCDLEDEMEQEKKVEVVRCKDCIYYKSNCCFNRQWDFESSVEVPLVRENDFCSYGEREEK